MYLIYVLYIYMCTYIYMPHAQRVRLLLPLVGGVKRPEIPHRAVQPFAARARARRARGQSSSAANERPDPSSAPPRVRWAEPRGPVRSDAADRDRRVARRRVEVAPVACQPHTRGVDAGGRLRPDLSRVGRIGSAAGAASMD